MTSELQQPPVSQHAQHGWGFEPDLNKQRVVRAFTGAFSGVWPGDVHKVKVRGSAGGGSGARTVSVTTGSGGGGAGQSCFGEIDVTPGHGFSLTVGAGGADTLTGTGSLNGNIGNVSAMVNGTRTPITLQAGNPGLASGVGGLATTASTFISLTGLTMVQGAAGGSGQVSAVGLPGGATDIVPGGLGGTVSGGGGGGASLTGTGGSGGNNGAVGTSAPIANSGAGGGGGGADVTTVGQWGGGAGAAGYWELEYWTEEEEA